MTYTAKYAHNDRDILGQLRLDAKDDRAAISEIKAFVESGTRGGQGGGGTWASTELSDGSACVFRNFFGEAVGGINT